MLPRPLLTTRKTLAPLKFQFFLGTAVSKLQYSFISFSVMWNATIPAKVLRNATTHIKTLNYVAEIIQAHFFSPKTLCYILHEKLLQIHVSKVLPSANPGSCDTDGLTLVTFSSNWNKVHVCFLKKWFQENQCAFNSKGQILYCYTDMRRFI